MKSRNLAQRETALWEFVRYRAILSPYFGELPQWAKETFLEKERELMPSALDLLNRIRLERSSSAAGVSREPSASQEKFYEEVHGPMARERELFSEKPRRRRRKRQESPRPEETESRLEKVPMTPPMLESSTRLRAQIVRMSQKSSAKRPWTYRIPQEVVINYAMGSMEKASLSELVDACRRSMSQ